MSQKPEHTARYDRRLTAREPLVIDRGHFELRDDRRACRFHIAPAFVSHTPDRAGVRFHVVAREFGGGLEDGSFELWYVNDTDHTERHIGNARDALEPAADAPLNPWIVVRPASFAHGSPLERVKEAFKSAGLTPAGVGAFLGNALANAMTRREIKSELEKGPKK